MKLPPFQTTNEGLAFALQNSGFKPAYLSNQYTAAKLASLGYDPAKWDALKAVRDARLKGKPGNVIFYFEDTPALRDALAGWDEQGADYEAGKITEVERPTKDGKNFGPLRGRDMMKLARQLTQTKGAFRDSVMGLPACFIHREGRAEKVDGANGEFTLVCPGFIMASEDLSPEKAERLGL